MVIITSERVPSYDLDLKKLKKILCKGKSGRFNKDCSFQQTKHVKEKVSDNGSKKSWDNYPSVSIQAKRSCGRIERNCTFNKKQLKFPGKVDSVNVVDSVGLEINEEEILMHAKNVAARRFMSMRNGVKQPSTAVLVTFAEDTLPERVTLGFLSFLVRPYERPPLRCYNCHRYGHVAAACGGRGEEVFQVCWRTCRGV